MQINALDNVEVHPEDGHKYALRDISKGENIIKYGQPIGHAPRALYGYYQAAVEYLA